MDKNEIGTVPLSGPKDCAKSGQVAQKVDDTSWLEDGDEEGPSTVNMEEEHWEKTIDLPYALLHPTEYLEFGIIASVPLEMQEKTAWRKLRELSLVYNLMNAALVKALRGMRVDYGGLGHLLTPEQRKMVGNWGRRKENGPIPIVVTILSRDQTSSTIETAEYGTLGVSDLWAIPAGVTTGYIFRHTTRKGGKYLRLGWRPYRKPKTSPKKTRKRKPNGSEFSGTEQGVRTS